MVRKLLITGFALRVLADDQHVVLPTTISAFVIPDIKFYFLQLLYQFKAI